MRGRAAATTTFSWYERTAHSVVGPTDIFDELFSRPDHSGRTNPPRPRQFTLFEIVCRKRFFHATRRASGLRDVCEYVRARVYTDCVAREKEKKKRALYSSNTSRVRTYYAIIRHEI